jgi:hypothetical protein
MAKKPINNSGKQDSKKTQLYVEPDHSPILKKIVGFSFFFIIGVLMFLGMVTSGGVIGTFLYKKIALGLFGYVGVLLPFILFYISIGVVFPDKLTPKIMDISMAILLILSVTGLLELLVPSLALGGLLGTGIGSLAVSLFSRLGGIIVLLLVSTIGTLVLFRASFNVLEWLSGLFHSETDEYEEDYEDEEDVLEEEIEKEPKKLTAPEKDMFES